MSTWINPHATNDLEDEDDVFYVAYISQLMF